MERIPILKMGTYLLVTIQVDMHDQRGDDAAGRSDRADRARARTRRAHRYFSRWISSIPSSAA